MARQRKDIAVKQSIPHEFRYGINHFNREFPDDDACLKFIQEQRWPNGVTHCEKCSKETKHHRVTGRTAYACDNCGSHVYPLAGTIFEKTTTSLRLWFYAMYLMGSTRCGISAKQIQRETNVTYKTAWRMFKQIRSLMSEGDLQLEGPTVEMDEAYFGGKRKGGTGRPMRGDKKKTPNRWDCGTQGPRSCESLSRRKRSKSTRDGSRTRHAREHHLHR
jgi:transposase-like protein